MFSPCSLATTRCSHSTRARVEEADHLGYRWSCDQDGLAPVIIDLMKRGYVSAIAANGSVLVHDAEIAMVGSTSEDVDATLSEGVFGGAEETGQLLNSAAREGAKDQIGLGEAIGRALLARNPKHRDYSLLCAAYESEFHSPPTSRSAATSLTSIQTLTAPH